MRINNYILLASSIVIGIVYSRTRHSVYPAQTVIRTTNYKPGKIRSGYDTLYATATSDPKDFYCTFAFEEGKEVEMKEFGKQLMRNNILSKDNPIAWVQALIDRVPDSEERRLCKSKVFEGMLEEAQSQKADLQIIILIENFL